MRRPLAFDDLGPDARLFAVVCLAAALLTILLVVLAVGKGPLEPGDLLPYFRAHRTRYIWSASVALSWLVASIPFLAALGTLLATDRRTLAIAATLLSTAGVLLLGFGSFLAIGSFFALDDASRGIAASLQAPYQAAIWRNLGFLLSDPGLMALGGGQVLFAWLALRTTLSRVTVIIGFIGGVAGLLTLGVYQTGSLALVQLAAFAWWAVATGITLFRR
ncbi:MAG TPA: hypothetical protein VFE23_14645 [Usitatibacter sp.]|nr:hypothetical protein [Usitatibacter sp.]